MATDFGRALLQLYGDVQKARDTSSYARMVATWLGVDAIPSEAACDAADLAYLAAEAAAAADKATRAAAHAAQKAANQTALNGIDVTSLNANDVKALLVFLLSEAGYVKKTNGTQIVDIP